MKILVIGGNGFVGSNLLFSLANLPGFEIFSISRKFDNNLLSLKKITFLSGSFESYLHDENFDFSRFDFIFFLAGISNILENENNIQKSYQQNYLYPKQLIDYLLAKKAKCKLIILSSRLEYGEVSSLPVTETILPEPSTVYGKNKLKLTQYALDNQVYPLEVIVLRVSNLYGLGNSGILDERLVLNAFIIAFFNNQPIKVYDHGEYIKDFLNITDLLTLLISETLMYKTTAGIYNVGYGSGISLRAAAEKISALTGARISYTQNHNRKKSIRDIDYIADIKKIHRHANWKPKVTLDIGVREVINFLKTT